MKLNFLKRIVDNTKSIFLPSKNVSLPSKNKQSSNKTYDIFNVCAYIIHYYSTHDTLISNLKLQKVLYFLQAYFLVNKHHLLFRDNILFCDWGVFVEEAHNYYNRYAGLSIPEREIYVRHIYPEDSLWFDTVPNDIECFSVEDKELMDTVLNRTLSYSSGYLLEVSSKQIKDMSLIKTTLFTKDSFRVVSLVPRREIIRYFNRSVE